MTVGLFQQCLNPSRLLPHPPLRLFGFHFLAFFLPCAAARRRASPQAPPQSCEALHSPYFKGECSGSTFGNTSTTSPSTSTSDDGGSTDVGGDGSGGADASSDDPEEEEEEEERAERQALLSRENKRDTTAVEAEVDVSATKASELWRIHGRYFDLTTFLDHHPVRERGTERETERPSRVITE